MSNAPVQLKVAGKTYQVVTSAKREDLERLAARVEEALELVVPPGREPSPRAYVLAAITLAHELEQAHEQRLASEAAHRETLNSLLGRIDRVLAETPVPAEAHAHTGRAKKKGGQGETPADEPR